MNKILSELYVVTFAWTSALCLAFVFVISINSTTDQYDKLKEIIEIEFTHRPHNSPIAEKISDRQAFKERTAVLFPKYRLTFNESSSSDDEVVRQTIDNDETSSKDSFTKKYILAKLGPFKTLTGPLWSNIETQSQFTYLYTYVLTTYRRQTYLLIFAIILISFVYLRKHSLQKLKNISIKIKQYEKSTHSLKELTHIAHDISKPYALMEILFKRLRSDIKGTKNLPYIEKGYEEFTGVKRSLDSMLDLLLYSQTKKKLNIDECSIDQIILESLKQSNVGYSQSQSDNLHLDIKLNCERYVLCDKQITIRILNNLIQNALDASKRNGVVFIRSEYLLSPESRAEIGTCRVLVGNTGKNVKPADKENIFQRKFSKKKGKHFGLGLAISKELAERQDAVLSLRTSTPTSTEFELNLPCSLKPEIKTSDRHFETSARNITSETDHFDQKSIIEKTQQVDQTQHLDKVQQTKQSTNSIDTAVIDDSGFVLDSWNDFYDGEIYLFQSPEAFLEAIKKGSIDCQLLKNIIVDFHFENSAINGPQLLDELIRAHKINASNFTRIFISSAINADSLLDAKYEGLVSGCIGKEPRKFE